MQRNRVEKTTNTVFLIKTLFMKLWSPNKTAGQNTRTFDLRPSTPESAIHFGYRFILFIEWIEKNILL